MLPLFFQVVLLDSASKAGARLIIPSLATPIGGVLSGIVMSRWGHLVRLVRSGAIIMVIGNALVTTLGFHDAKWKYFVYVFPANLGQGMIYPAILFTFLAAFDHAGTYIYLEYLPYPLLTDCRSCCIRLNRLPDSLFRHSLGSCNNLRHCSKYAQHSPPRGTEWNTRQMDSKTFGVRLEFMIAGVQLLIHTFGNQIINEIRHSVTALHKLPTDVQMKARFVYYDGIKWSFAVSTGFAVVATVAAVFASGRGLRTTRK
jgi:hypothetical protein